MGNGSIGTAGILLTNCRVVKHGNDMKETNILVVDGVIAAIGPDIAPRSVVRRVNMNRALATPGLIDIHTHLREPGNTHEISKETIKTGTLAAAHGGFTTVCAMPNLDPVPDTPEHLAVEQAIIKRDARVKVLPYAAITQSRTSDTPVDFDAMAAAGAFGFSNDGSGVQSATTMRRAMEAAARLGKPIATHAEDEQLMGSGDARKVIRECPAARKLDLPIWTADIEASQIARDLELAKQTGAHYHVCHVSTQESLTLIRRAKSEGVHVTAEACPHHLLLTVDDIPFGADDGRTTDYKMNPPLPTKADQQALIEALLDGTIDIIATDHAPHQPVDKGDDFLKAAYGIVGLETAFAVLYTKLVESGIATLEQLIGWLSTKPAQLFGIPGGHLRVGERADIAFFDIEHTYRIQAEDFESKSSNTPFIGWGVEGKTVMTLAEGKVAWTEK
jgi:dihydroorotase